MQNQRFLQRSFFYLKTFRSSIFISASLILSLLLSLKVVAQGDLLVMPKRIVFEGSKRSHELNLANTGKDTARYNISLVHYRMKEDGSFEEITINDSTQNFADKFVRFFPRSVVLGPNESQAVRIQLTQTNNLLSGEYRSHLYFRAVPNEKPLGIGDIKKADSSAISVRLTPVFGISIPVIIRVGESTVKMNLSDCTVEMFDVNTPLLKMTLNRTGNMSAYGDIAVEHISPQGKVTQVGNVQGLAVYTPNSIRRIKIGLNNTAGVDYRKGKLHIVYKTKPESKSVHFAETELLLN